MRRLIVGGTPCFQRIPIWTSRCGVFAGNHRAGRSRLWNKVCRPPLHTGGTPLDAGREPSGARQALPGPRSQGGRSGPGGPASTLLEPFTRRPCSIAKNTLIETAQAETIAIGTPLLAIPTHICPTVALHRRAYVIEDGELVGQWEVTARIGFWVSEGDKSIRSLAFFDRLLQCG